MLNIIEIVKALIISFNPNPKQRDIANERAETCKTCPHIKYYTHIDTHMCGICGCPISSKIFSPQSGQKACPDSRWVR